jgi:hypothetical protein
VGALEERSMCADIARALARRNKSGVYRVLALKGGIAPASRRRGPRALRLEELEEISRSIATHRTKRTIRPHPRLSAIGVTADSG